MADFPCKSNTSAYCFETIIWWDLKSAGPGPPSLVELGTLILDLVFTLFMGLCTCRNEFSLSWCAF